jgi:hypothetical protein
VRCSFRNVIPTTVVVFAGSVYMRRPDRRRHRHQMTPPDAQLRVSDDSFVCLQYQVPRRSPSHHHDVLSPLIMGSWECRQSWSTLTHLVLKVIIPCNVSVWRDFSWTYFLWRTLKQERLWKAIDNSDLETARLLLERGTVGVNAGSEWVRLLSGPSLIGPVTCGLTGGSPSQMIYQSQWTYVIMRRTSTIWSS